MYTIAHVMKGYAHAVRISAESINVIIDARKEVVEKVEEFWISKVGLAIRSLCKISERAY
jgi:hypothetical protein